MTTKTKTNQVSKIKLVTKHKLMLPKIDGIIKKLIFFLHSNDALKSLFPTFLLYNL